MSMEIYTGQAYRQGERYVRIDKEGRIYISAELARQIKPRPEEMEIGYDQDTRELSLWPATDDGGTRYKAQYDKGNIALSVRGPLNYWGLRTKQPVRYSARWTSGRILVATAAPSPQEPRTRANVGPKENALAPRTTPASPPPNDKDGGDLLDTRAVAALIGTAPPTVHVMVSQGKFPEACGKRGLRNVWSREDVERWLRERDAKAAARRAAAAARSGKVEATTLEDRTCATCGDRVTLGRQTICRSQSSARRHKAVQPTDTCDWHRKPGVPYRPVPVDAE